MEDPAGSKKVVVEEAIVGLLLVSAGPTFSSSAANISQLLTRLLQSRSKGAILEKFHLGIKVAATLFGQLHEIAAGFYLSFSHRLDCAHASFNCCPCIQESITYTDRRGRLVNVSPLPPLIAGPLFYSTLGPLMVVPARDITGVESIIDLRNAFSLAPPPFIIR